MFLIKLSISILKRPDGKREFIFVIIKPNNWKKRNEFIQKRLYPPPDKSIYVYYCLNI